MGKKIKWGRRAEGKGEVRGRKERGREEGRREGMREEVKTGREWKEKGIGKGKDSS